MRSEILELIYAAIDGLNAESTDGVNLEKSEATRLLGSETGLDSLAFINLIVGIETQIERRMGKSVVLVDEGSMANDEHPFLTVGTLAAYVERVLAAQPTA